MQSEIRDAVLIKMEWENSIVEFVKGLYEKGVKLTKKAMEQLEMGFDRIPGIEKWAVDIPCYQQNLVILLTKEDFLS